jgi:hypothetical protein
MEPVTLDDLKTFAKELDGQTLVTRFQHCRFSLSVSEEGCKYTPELRGKERHQPWRWIGRILDRFNETRSLHPSDYKSVHASYVLTIIGEYLESLPAIA